MLKLRCSRLPRMSFGGSADVANAAAVEAMNEHREIPLLMFFS